MKIIEARNPFSAPVYHEKNVTSTMDYSKKLASEGATHGTVITADFQEAGRGRGLYRVWEMESVKNLPFTVLLKYKNIQEIPAALTLKTGLAVSYAIEDFVPVLQGNVFVKWPNDIYINHKKICGILCETDGSNVHIGIGVNVMQEEFPSHLEKKATSIFLEINNIEEILYTNDPRFDLLEKILARLYYELESKNDDWKERIEKRLYKKGEKVIFIEGCSDSKNETKGLLIGINKNGELLVLPEDAQEPQTFITGEIKFK